MSFAGRLFVQLHDRLALAGKWVEHPKYGRQLEVESMEYDLELDGEGLASYLAKHPSIKGIGPKKARVLAERFGHDFDRALAEDAEAMAQAARVRLETIHALRDEWQRTRALNAVMTWLSAFGLTHHQVTTLVDRFGNSTAALLKEDPYLLIREIRGMGFKRVDRIARQTGTSKEHPGRVRAGILHCVDEAIDRGDCWVEFEELVARANTLLVMDTLDSREKIERTLEALIDCEALTCSSHGGRFLVARPWLRQMEVELAEVLAGGATPNPHFEDVLDLDGLVIAAGPNLHESQREAVASALRYSIVVISGAAGSGKTHSVAAIVRAYQQQGLEVLLAAPTGKAAKRLEQVVGEEAKTIHRLLRFDGQAFLHGPEYPLKADVVIVDEASMIDVPLAWQLLRAIYLSRTCLVLVGDHHQLPPVGPGNLLRDLIRTRAVPTVILDRIVRQAGILRENSLAILSGAVAKTSEAEPSGRRAWYRVDQFKRDLDARRFLLELHEEILAERLGFDLVTDVQVLTPTHKGALGTVALNIELQRLIQRKLWGVEAPAVPPGRRPRFLARDKVIQTRNNYDIGVMNGAVGFVQSIMGNGAMVIDFDGLPVEIEAGSSGLQDIQLAYAISIHKAQGSEYPCAVVVIHKAHTFMHHRNLFYTGVTRARESAVIIGDQWGMRNCAQQRQVDRRRTFLSFLLVGDE